MEALPRTVSLTTRECVVTFRLVGTDDQIRGQVAVDVATESSNVHLDSSEFEWAVDRQRSLSSFVADVCSVARQREPMDLRRLIEQPDEPVRVWPADPGFEFRLVVDYIQHEDICVMFLVNLGPWEPGGTEGTFAGVETYVTPDELSSFASELRPHAQFDAPGSKSVDPLD